MRAKLESIAGDPAGAEGEGAAELNRDGTTSKQAGAAIKQGVGRKRKGRKRERETGRSPSMDFLRLRNLRLDYLFVGAINVGRARCDENLSIRVAAGGFVY